MSETIPQIMLLTAAINTSAAMKNNKRSDVTLRRSDYRNGLEHYIDTLPETTRHIVFCENTGADLSDFEPLKARATARGKTLEFVSFTGTVSPTLGKGACEFEILDHAYRWMIERYPPHTLVWKVTGRLLVKNIDRMIQSRPSQAEIYVDMRSVPLIGEKLGGNDWTEMRLMCYTLGAYGQFLEGRGESFGFVTEKGLFQYLSGLDMQGISMVPRFRVQPRFKGICGGSNKDYESGSYRMKDGLRSFTRSVIPQLWL